MPSPRVMLGRRLRQARNDAGLGQVAMAAFLDISQALISRVESGQRGLTVDVVRRWLERAGTPDEVRDEVLALAELAAGGTDTRQWDELKADGWDPHQKRYGDLEREAVAVRIYQNSLVPGLLQTPRYVEYLMRDVLQEPADAVAEAVSARLRRQEALYSRDTRLDVVIAECVLRQPFGGWDVLTEQLERIAAAAHLPSVDLAVLRSDTAMPETWGTHFVLLEMPDEPDSQVLIELDAEEVRVTDPAKVARYRDLHALYRRHSLAGEAAIDYVRGLAEVARLRQGGIE